MLFLSRRATAAAAAAKHTRTAANARSRMDAAAAAAAAAPERADGGNAVGGRAKQERAPRKPTDAAGKPHRPPKQDPDAIRTIADNPGSPFFELGLAISCAGKGKTRVRQHVNPLRAEFSAPPPPPDWSKAFADPTLPLVVDVGCGQGRFLLLLARRMRELRAAAQQQQGQPQNSPPPKQSPAVLLPLLPPNEEAAATATTTMTTATATIPPCNFLGIEIREPLVERANRWTELLDLQDHVAFCFANATVALPSGFLDGYPGHVAACLVQFPDPHFKRRHFKRRVLQPALARFLRDRVAPGGCVFLQSDIYSAAAAMRDAVEEEVGGAFELSGEHFEAGATFPDAGPPADQVRGGGGGGGGGAGAQKQQSKKQKKGDDADGGGGGQQQTAAAGGGGGDNDDEQADGDSDADDDVAPFMSAWSREGGWLSANPIGVPTEREHYVTSGGKSIFRVLLRRRRA